MEIFLSYFWKVQLCQIECGEYREEIEVLDEAADDERVTFLSFSILYHLIIIKKTFKKIQKGIHNLQMIITSLSRQREKFDIDFSVDDLLSVYI